MAPVPSPHPAAQVFQAWGGGRGEPIFLGSMDEDETHDDYFSCQECEGIEECDEDCRCDVCTENLADQQEAIQNDRD